MALKATHSRRSARKIGTLVRIRWSKFATSLSEIEAARFLQIAEDFAWLNPNLDLTVRLGKKLKRYKPTDAAWPHWKANKPTSPHWYNLERFTRLVSRYADEKKGMTVRAFVATFDGLSATAKQKAVLDATGLTRATLISIARDQRVLRKLLAAMQEASREVKPELLGVMGEKHFRRRCKEAGCFMPHFRYVRGSDLIDGVPSLVEVAFCTDPKSDNYVDTELIDADDAASEEVVEVGRRLITGVNWAPGLRDTFRDIGYGKSLDTLLGDKLISYPDPVYFIVHVVCPRPQWMDRGKSGVVLPMSYSKFEQLIDAATKHWQKQRRAEIKDERASERRFRQLNRTKTQIEVAFAHMHEAYMKASDNGTLPANQRQIMYALRPKVIDELPGTDPSNFDTYFHGTLLDAYLNKYEPDWADNVVRDARGTLLEPHTGREIALGTLAVRSYLQRVKSHKVSEPSFALTEARYPTLGPKHAFGAILFVEKEGFEPLFRAAQIAERFDVAIMSTKGMSVRAARQLIDELHRYNVPVFALHDCDKAGFSIFGTLGRDSIRYKFRHNKGIAVGASYRSPRPLSEETKERLRSARHCLPVRMSA